MGNFCVGFDRMGNFSGKFLFIRNLIDGSWTFYVFLFCTQRNIIPSLIKLNWIRSCWHFSSSFQNKRHTVCFGIKRKIINWSQISLVKSHRENSYLVKFHQENSQMVKYHLENYHLIKLYLRIPQLKGEKYISPEFLHNRIPVFN